MSSHKVSIKYAKSLLANSIENNTLSTISKDADLLLNVLNENQQLIRVLESPIIKREMKQTILAEIFRERVSEEFFSFMTFLVNKGRESLILDVLSKFEKIKNESMGIVKVDLTTSNEVSEQQLSSIKLVLEKILNKSVIFSQSVDQSLIGGFIAQVDDKMYDASIKHQLELMRKQLVNGAVVI